VQRNTIVVLTLNALNIVDLITTYVALRGGNFHELNLIMLTLFKISPILMVLFKLSVVLSISILLIKLKSVDMDKILNKSIYFGLFLGVGFSATVLGYVSVHNIILLMGV